MVHTVWSIENTIYSVNKKDPVTAEAELLAELEIYDPDGDTVIPGMYSIYILIKSTLVMAHHWWCDESLQLY